LTAKFNHLLLWYPINKIID